MGNEFRATTGSAVNVVKRGTFKRHTYVALACSGRSVTGCLPTSEPVTCKSCLKRFAGNADLLGVAVEMEGCQVMASPFTSWEGDSNTFKALKRMAEDRDHCLQCGQGWGHHCIVCGRCKFGCSHELDLPDEPGGR